MCSQRLVPQVHLDTATLGWRRQQQTGVAKTVSELRKSWFNVKRVSQCDGHHVLLSNTLVFALIARHSEWILNHLVRNDFMVEDDNRVIKMSLYENHAGNSAPRSTQLLTRILVGRREIDYKQPGFQ